MKVFFGLIFAIFLIGIASIIFGWIQVGINTLIPHNEYYGIIHLASIIANICILGSVYVWLFLAGILFFFKDLS